MDKKYFKIDISRLIGVVAMVVMVMGILAEALHLWEYFVLYQTTASGVAHEISHDELMEDIIADGLIVILMIFSVFIMWFYYRRFQAAQEMYRISEEKFRALVESSPDCIKYLDVKGKLLYLSPGGLAEHKLSKMEDGVGFDYMATIEKEYHPQVAAAFAEALKGKTTTFPIKHVPGVCTRDWCSLTLAPVKNKSGEVISVFGVSRDIDTLKKNEERLAVDKQALEGFLNSAGEAIVAIDRTWNVTLWSAQAEAITGITKKQAIGKPFRSILHFINESTRDESITAIEESMLYNKIVPFPGHLLLAKDGGTEIPIEGSASPLLGVDGSVVGAEVVFMDASSKHNTQMVSSEFAYASHQLRTPVTKALWYIEAAMTKSECADVKKDVAVAFEAMKSVHKLSTELVEVAGIEQNMVVPEIEVVRIKDSIAAAVASLEKVATAKGVVVSVSFDPAVAGVKTDKKIFQRILTEVLENAINHSPSGKDVILRTMQAQEALLIEVEDFGEGVAQEQQALVFSKFFRGYDAKTRETPGAGLGLYIAQRYAQLLKGRLWFQSVPGKSTIFYLSLPLPAAPKITPF
jgi:PAS domain S-box-containing protein